LAFAMLIVSLDQYIVVVALPDIGRDLGFSDQTLQSVISAYAVASAGFLLLGGRAADLLGRRRILVSGLGLYAGASRQEIRRRRERSQRVRRLASSWGGQPAP
jgi:MFS family permease